MGARLLRARLLPDDQEGPPERGFQRRDHLQEGRPAGEGARRRPPSHASLLPSSLARLPPPPPHIPQPL
ncbi:hypothetical protein E2320_014085, partial [Naja naja]